MPKQQRVLTAIRREIINGRFAEIRQLPSQAQLARDFRVSLVTVGLVMNQLAREGFVQARHGSGTFLADRPPHKNNYALVFWNDPTSRYAWAEWSRYHTALTSEAQAIERREGRKMLIFHGINQHTDSEDRQRLLSYIQAHRLSGIIFANNPIYLENTPILDEPGIARVGLMSLDEQYKVPSVGNRGEQWVEKALNYLATRGRKRVAILRLGRGFASDETITQMAAERGMTIPDYWRQEVPLVYAPAIRKCVQLLMYGAGAQRPDGLLIMDDNFVEDAQAALVDAGVRVPDDLEVVAHCNFPWPPAKVLPVKRLGYNIADSLRACVDLIDRQRQGEQVPMRTQLPAQFEEELTISDAAVEAVAAHLSG